MCDAPSMSPPPPGERIEMVAMPSGEVSEMNPLEMTYAVS